MTKPLVMIEVIIPGLNYNKVNITFLNGLSEGTTLKPKLNLL